MALAMLVPAPCRAGEGIPLATSSMALLPPLRDLGEGRLLPGFRSAGRHINGGPQQGFLLGLDVGPQLMLLEPAAERQIDLTLGAHAGYAFGNGLALLGRFDALGTHALLLPGPRLDLLTGAVRYSFPFLLPQPFIEAGLGAAFIDPQSGAAPGVISEDVTVCGGPALGLAFPIGPFFTIQLSARDWLVFFRSGTLQTLAAELGIEVNL